MEYIKQVVCVCLSAAAIVGSFTWIYLMIIVMRDLGGRK